jgi:hypothetical protein
MSTSVDVKGLQPPKSLTEFSPDELKLLAASVLAKAQEARHDPVKFFAFALREERTQAPIIVQPHQALVIEFVMAHEFCVLMLPVGTSKTFTIAGLAVYLLGQDNTNRGAFVSAVQNQSKKPLAFAKDYIEAPATKLVFPQLRRSPSKPWREDQIFVDRPQGIRDPSLAAYGLESGLPGSRLSFVIPDDILTHENTATKGQRDKTMEFLDTSVFSRIDPGTHSKTIVMNTAWHPDDAVHRLQKRGWPTLKMDVYGDIQIFNTTFDSAILRPKSQYSPICRLISHDSTVWDRYRNDGGDVPLWPGRYTWEEILKIKGKSLPHEFNQLYLNECRDDQAARCKIEYIEQCKQPGLTMVSEYRGSNLTVTGVDLAIKPGEEHDDTAFFTFEVLPNNTRRILDVEIGQYDGPSIVRKIIQKQKAYKSIVRVESNAAQDYIRQFVLENNAAMHIVPHNTDQNKHYGIEALFIELSNKAWLIPCDGYRQCHPMIQKWIDACLYYNPTTHVDDALMACWFALEQAKEFGHNIIGGILQDGNVSHNLNNLTSR